MEDSFNTPLPTLSMMAPFATWKYHHHPLHHYYHHQHHTAAAAAAAAVDATATDTAATSIALPPTKPLMTTKPNPSLSTCLDPI